MSWELVNSSSFDKNVSKYTKHDAKFKNEIIEILRILSENPYDPKLKTHKLKGTLKGSLSCSINFNLRLIFSFDTVKDKFGRKREVIILETIGTHDEVY